MDRFRQQIDAIRNRLGGLDTTAKLLIGSLMVTLAMGLFLVAQYASEPEMVPLAVTAAAQEDAKKFLADHRYTYREENGQILVASEHQPTIISQMGEQGVGGAEAIDFNALVALENPFETLRQTEQRKLIALQNVLGRTIAGFRGVRSATVMIAPRPQPGLGQSAIAQSASVHVVMKSGETLTQAQVDAIAALVAGSQAGLRAEFVAITDGDGPRRARAGRERLAGEHLEHQIRVAEAVRDRIQTLLANIPGVLVSVNPQVITKTVQETETKFGDGVVAPTSESRLETSMRGAAPAEAPGVRPNVGMAVVDPRGTGASSSSEKAETRFDARIPSSQRNAFDPTGYAVKIDVGVAVPWSYFRKVWDMKQKASGQPTDSAPDEASLAQVRDEEIERIRKLLDTQIQTDATTDSKKGMVEVTWFYDFDADGRAAGTGGGAAAVIDAIAPGSPGSGLVKTIALGGLALLALFMMLMMVRKAGERPELPSAAELAGVPPTLETDAADIVGEADESTPALEGLELDDGGLQRQQMLSQLNDFVKRDSREAAGLMKRWMRAPA